MMISKSKLYDDISNAIAIGDVHPLNLHIADDIATGFVLTFPDDGVGASTGTLAYDDQRDLLDYVQRGELPFFIADLLEHSPVNVYYKGCVAVRLTTSGTDRHRLIVLCPSALSVSADLDAMLRACPIDQRRRLQTKFWQMIAPMDILTDRHHRSYWIPDTHRIRSMNRRSQPYRLLRKRRENHVVMRRVAHILQHQRSSSSIIDDPDLSRSATIHAVGLTLKQSPMMRAQWRPMLPSTKLPLDIAEKKWRKQPTLGAADDLDMFEEIQVEMAATDGGGAHRTRLIISRHDASATFWGQVHLQGNPPVKNGPFLLGVEWDAKMYVLQYLEMITEGGRRQPVSVVRNVAGKPPHVISSSSKVPGAGARLTSTSDPSV